MDRIYTVVVLLAFCICNIVLGLGEQYCFTFTWPGSNNATLNNCNNNTVNNVPCVEPFYYSISKPNTRYIWEENREKVKESKYFCELNSGSVCIRYTYMYNDAVVNASYFCGKVIEDQTSAITSGCYAQHTEGYIIEACACQSRNNSMPCNATIKNTYSIIITIGATVATLFVYKIFNFS